MKHILFKEFLLIASICCTLSATHAQKVIVPITENGAWTYNSQPASIYHDGKVFFSWITNSGNLMLSSYDQTTDEVHTVTIAAGYGTEDFSSPTLLVRSSGQLLVFASKNQTENNFQCYRSTSTTGDITAGFTVQNMTGYGINATLPYAIGEDIVVFWRSKNNLGYSYFANVNTETNTAALPGTPTKRAGFLGTTIGNSYDQRDEVPRMNAMQDADGNIHMVITQLGTGLRFSNSTVHYTKITVDATKSGLNFQTAAGINAALNFDTPPDIVFASTEAEIKAIAYDITLIEGKPAILYDTFTAENVNASTNPGSSSNHQYTLAKWDGTQWNNHTVVNAGDGLPIQQFTAVGGRTFFANSYQAGGMCFDVNDPSTVYLSKKGVSGTFEIFKFTSADQGESWSEAEAITGGTPTEKVNIRPVQVTYSPSGKTVELLWMQGVYSSPANYATAIVSRGQGVPATSFAFETDAHYLVVDEVIKPMYRFSPLFVADRSVLLESSNPSIAIITEDGKIKGIGSGTARITATSVSNPSLTASCDVIVEERSVFEVFMDRIVEEAYADRISTISTLDQLVANHLQLLLPNGSFPDVDYASTDRTNWAPLTHLNRMLDMALAYTSPESSYFSSTSLKEQMDGMLQYWQLQAPRSNNWYQNEIAEPQRMGLFLILIQHMGAEQLPETLLNDAIVRLRDRGGNPGSQAGANRIDVALHWVYRACLTNDRNLLQAAMDYIYSPVEYTTGSEGIQYDNSYTQHGRQLHIGSYGEVFMNGVTRATLYAVGTPYAIPENNLQILSKLIKDTYLNAFRGNSIFFNVIGRASTRPGATLKQGTNKIVERMTIIDPANAAVYEAANLRFRGEQAPSYQINAGSTHFYKSDYTLHRRPAYSADLRMVSTRTVRNEYLKDNFEGKKQYFLSDGAMGIFVDGNEYADIFPVWDWAKIPGVTNPILPEIPQLSTYIKMGQSDFVGGVSDSLNSVSVYKYNDTEFNINTSANKAWFFFDKEIVCLGSGINSASDYPIHTTINQCLLHGNITVASDNSQRVITKGTELNDEELNWAFHAGVGYYFPKRSRIQLVANEQTGSWFEINGNYSSDMVSKDVFTISIDHGTKPQDESYAYIIVPGLENETKAASYNVEKIQILCNADSLQAIYNSESGIYGFVFYAAGAYKTDGLIIEVDAPCVVMVSNVSSKKATVHVSDPTNGSNPIKVGISIPGLTGRRQINYQASAPYTGETQRFEINENSELFTGRNILHDRKNWTITTSIEGVADDAVYGDDPNYIIDEDTRSSFVFVKPGRTFGGITAPADYIPSFTIDMGQSQELSYFQYRHRTYNNTTDFLRAKRLSFYGKLEEVGEFTNIINDLPIATNVAEVQVDLPENTRYRFVKLAITEWDNVTGNTVQVSDFNLGYFGMSIPDELVSSNESLKTDAKSQLQVWPNPINTGDKLNVELPAGVDKVKCEILNLQGRVMQTSYTHQVSTHNLAIGLYILKVTNLHNWEQHYLKFLVK